MGWQNVGQNVNLKNPWSDDADDADEPTTPPDACSRNPGECFLRREPMRRRQLRHRRPGLGILTPTIIVAFRRTTRIIDYAFRMSHSNSYNYTGKV